MWGMLGLECLYDVDLHMSKYNEWEKQKVVARNGHTRIFFLLVASTVGMSHRPTQNLVRITSSHGPLVIKRHKGIGRDD